MKLTLKQILYILITLTFLTVSYFAQSTKKIYGYVYDEKTNTPLVGANVTIIGTVLGTVTDENGYFQFDNLLTGLYSINVSFIGYKNKTVNDIRVTIEQPVKINFHLSPKINRLDEIVVTSNSEVQQSFGTLHLYTKNDIEKSNCQLLGEFLQDLPAIEIQSTGGLGSSKKISIRGSQSNQVLVLLDGIKLNNQLGGDVDLSQIPTNIIERIEIYEGGNSSKFGNGAIGGTINIITKNKFNNKIKLNTAIGSYGYWKIEPLISGNYRNISYYFSYNKIKSKGDYPYTYKNNALKIVEDIRLNGNFQSENIFGRINYRLGNNLVSANIQIFNSERGLPGGIYSLTPYAGSSDSKNIFALNYIGNFTKINVKSNLTYSNSLTDYFNLFPDSAKPKYKRMPKYHYKYITDDITGNLDIIYIPNDWYKLTTGYNIKYFNYEDENFLPTLKSPINKANDFSQGIFLHQEFKKNFNWNNFQIIMSPVIRYDVISLTNNENTRNEKQWNPGISLLFSAGTQNKISVKTNYSKSFRMPTFADLFYQDVRVEGKANLLPESGINTDITLRTETNFYGKLTAEATAFKNIIDNMIVWKLGSFEVFRPFNTNAEITGTQYNLSYTFPNEFISLGIFHTNIEALNKSNNKTTYNKIIPYKPLTSTKIKIGIKYNILNFNFFYRAVGKRYVTEANTIEMPPYNVFDAKLNLQVHLLKLTMLWKLSVTNITNEKYQIIRNYPLPLREWKLGFTISY